MPMTGVVLLGGVAPSEPWNPASPKLNTPPSAATSQYPRPSGVGAIPTTGALSGGSAHRAVEGRIAEAEHPSVGRHQPVPATVGGRSDPDHRSVERGSTHRAVEGRIREAEHPSVGACQPEAHCLGDRRDPHHRGIGKQPGRRALIGRVAEVEGEATEAGHPVPATVGRRSDPDDLPRPGWETTSTPEP